MATMLCCSVCSSLIDAGWITDCLGVVLAANGEHSVRDETGGEFADGVDAGRIADGRGVVLTAYGHSEHSVCDETGD